MMNCIIQEVMLLISEISGLNLISKASNNAGMINTKVITAANPAFSEDKYFLIHLLFDQISNIFEPSKGGIGNRLNIAKIKLIKII